MMDSKALLAKALPCVRETGQWIQSAISQVKSGDIIYKGTNDLVSFVDQQAESAKKEWQSQNIPGSTAIGLAQEALGIEGGMTGESAKLFNTMVNLQNKKAELYGQLLTLNRLVYTNEDVFKRDAELGIKAAAESVVEKGYGFSLFSDKNTMRTRMQEVEETKRFF
jgi:hypothetical protein